MPSLADFRRQIEPMMQELIAQGASREKTLKLVEEVSVSYLPDKPVRDALMLEAGKFYDELISLR
jgi:hypothetical protein